MTRTEGSVCAAGGTWRSKERTNFYGDCSEKLDGFDNTCKNGLDFLISGQKKKSLCHRHLVMERVMLLLHDRSDRGQWAAKAVVVVER